MKFNLRENQILEQKKNRALAEIRITPYKYSVYNFFCVNLVKAIPTTKTKTSHAAAV
jgi:hypothetical protein